MAYTLHTEDGTPIAGDARLEQHMKARCDEINGYVTDDNGNRVYPLEG